VKVKWFDHHVWKDQWIKMLRDAGAEVLVDTSTCGAGVVLRGTNSQDEISKRIVSADCAVDMWWHDDPMGEKLRRVIEASRDFSWKEKIVEKLFRGVLWDQEFQSILEEQMDQELKGYSKLRDYFRVVEVDGVRVAIALRWRGRPDISYAAQYFMSRSGAKIFVSANGKSISFRSSSYVVRDYAVKFGGGGHPLAAGGQLKIPWFRRLLFSLGLKGPALSWVASRVVQAMREVGLKETTNS